MPPPRDLTGLRLGRLLITGRGPDAVSESGKSREQQWFCRCDCGETELIPARRLPYVASNARRSDAVEACASCREARTCAFCSRVFRSRQFKACCSEACHTAHRRAIDLDAYYRKTAADPEFNRKKAAAVRARSQADPDFRARLAAWEANSNERHKARMASDPEYREQVNARARESYAANAEAIQARRRERIARLTTAQLEELQERARASGREWRRKWRLTPEGQRINRERSRDATRKAQLSRLQDIGAELARRKDKK